MTAGKDRASWVFDSACVLCDGAVTYTLRHEKTDSIRFVAIASEEGRRLALAHGLDPDDPVSFLFIEGAQAWQGSDAMLALSRHLNGPARLIGLIQVLPRRAREAIYLWIARHRYRLFGRLDACRIPTAAEAERLTL